MLGSLARTRLPFSQTHVSAQTQRWISTSRPLFSDNQTQLDSKAYSKSLLLPKTRFQLWNNPNQSEVPFRERSCDDLYEWQREQEERPLFVLHDGPPYANGRLHMGHALNKIVKDIINRFHVLRGHRVHYIPGWDCHGLPIEHQVLKQMRVTASSLPPQTIRKAASDFAQTEIETQKNEFKQLGIMADWMPESTYRTMDPKYEMRQLRVFQQMVESGLIYRHYRPVHYSPSSRSALAEAELSYKDDHISHSVYVAFTVDTKAQGINPILREILAGHVDVPTKLLAWTTTPWTLTANMGIAVHPELDYSVLKTGNEILIVGSDRLSRLKETIGETDEIARVKGSALVDLSYLPLFSPVAPDVTPMAPLRVVPSSHVTADAGTGLVHCAPAHGAEDYHLFRSLGLLVPTSKDANQATMLCHVDGAGEFTEDVKTVLGEKAGAELIGKDVLKEGGKAMVSLLQDSGVLVRVQRIKHRYPHDWRTKEPIIMLATSQWFADLAPIKEDALKSLETVHFYPRQSRNRLESFVRNRSEWCISRQRVWGVPIPALYNTETDAAVMNSETINHILTILEVKGVSYWWDGPVKEFLPPLLKEDGQTYRKGTDTMDVWFDSGTSWTMLQNIKEQEDREAYADVCVEGSDQHRGWFQSQLLTAIATAGWEKKGTAPYGTLITHGMVLDQDGKKMSKSLGNVISPMTIVNGEKDKKKSPGYGADVLRLWAATVEYWRDVEIGNNILAQTADSLKRIRNSLRFILGNTEDGRVFPELERVKREDMTLADRYVMHKLYEVEQTALEAYASYNFPKVISTINNFTNVTLSSLYYDITKDCLYADSKLGVERRAVLTVLETVLKILTTILAPILPHLAEEVHHILRTSENEKGRKVVSFFRKTWTPLSAEWEDKELERDMDELLRIRSAALLLLEKARQDKRIGSSLEAEVDFIVPKSMEGSANIDLIRREGGFLITLLIVSDVSITDEASMSGSSPAWSYEDSISLPGCDGNLSIRVQPATLHKCPRCWSFSRPEEEALCKRCASVLHQ